MKVTMIPASVSRVHQNTSRKNNKKINDELFRNVSKYTHANKADLSERIEQLNKEWDTERILEANAAAIILIGTILGYLINVWLFLICGFISFYLLMHAVEGWCPPLPLLRKLGVRTAYEICTEKMIMKYLRGDFENLPHNAAELIEAAQSETAEEKSTL